MSTSFFFFNYFLSYIALGPLSKVNHELVG